MFDAAAARAQFLRGLSPDRSSTQAWDVETWSATWRDADGQLKPGALGPDGGSWWFRAITDTGRLTAEPADISTEPLTSVGAGARIAAFLGEANQILVHWPTSALAPIAFPLREALGLNEAFAVIAETLPAAELTPFVAWFGPLDANVARRWMMELDDPSLIAALGLGSREFELALERLTTVGAVGEASKLAAAAPTAMRVKFVLQSRQPVSMELLEASIDEVDDDTFVALASRAMRKRDRRLWDALTQRPLPALAASVVDHLEQPVAPWVFRFLEAGGEPMIDALIELARGRGKRAAAALRALSHLDRTAVQLRIDEHSGAVKKRLLTKLQPDRGERPELPEEQWPAWMAAVSRRVAAPEPAWFDPSDLPPLLTQTGHRLPPGVQQGVIALLQAVRFDVVGDGRTPNQYDPTLDELRGFLDSESANAWWNALFAMWWTNHRPEVRWVMYAAAFLCDGTAIRDLGAKLRRHQTWFGTLSTRVIAALGHNPTPWAVAALDDITHRSSNATHREIAANFLRRRADSAGVTVDRFVAFNYPDEADPVLIDAAARRTEAAMVEQRAWNDFLLLEHLKIAPFKYVGEAVVWGARSPWSDDVTFFYVADGEFVDVTGEPLEVDIEHTITVAHPAQFSDAELILWHQHCADHEIVQPFAQLERPRYRAASLSRDGFLSPVGAPIAGRDFLRRADPAGWKPIRQGSHGNIVAIAREFAALDARVELRFTTALEHDGSGESTIAGIAFSSASGEPVDAIDIDPVAFSEAHYDIARLMVKTP